MISVTIIPIVLCLSQVTGRTATSTTSLEKNVTDVLEEPDVVKVSTRDTVKLQCKSIDATHNFHYWHIQHSNEIIGPENQYNYFKYDYEILSGNLTVREISETDEGLYNCFSKGIIRQDDTKITTVHLFVSVKDWENIYEHDPKVNALRVILALLSSAIFCGFVYIAYQLWKDRYSTPKYLEHLNAEEEDGGDDSGEDVFTAPGTSKNYRETIVRDKGFGPDSPGISTEFSSILDHK